MLDGRWRSGVDRVTRPVGAFLVACRVTPDQLTLFGLAMSVGGAFAIGTGHLAWGVVSLFATGLPDLLDGPVAKAAGASSTRGAFLDSVSDRVSDAFLLGGLAWYLAGRHGARAAVLAFAILAASTLVSYERAKAESLGLSAKGGVMERAERFVVLGLALVLPAAMVAILWAMLGLTVLTALGRFLTVCRQAPGPPATVSSHRPSTIRSWRERHAGGGPSRWRQRQREEVSTRAGRFARQRRERAQQARALLGRAGREVAASSLVRPRLESMRSRRGR